MPLAGLPSRVLRPVYPEDLEPGKRALALFLGQYWGGPPEYSAEKGHPRLRMRHAPFAIGEPQRDAWLASMFTEDVTVRLPAGGHTGCDGLDETLRTIVALWGPTLHQTSDYRIDPLGSHTRFTAKLIVLRR